MSVLFQITSPYFCVGGILVSDGGAYLVSQAAPIIAYMSGWSPERIVGYCRRKKWRVAPVESQAG